MNFRMTTEEWTDQEGLGYRIVHRSTGFYACVQAIGPSGVWWDFAWHRRPYRTHDAAVKACKRNRSLWERFVKLGAARGNRRARLQELDAKGRSGGANALGSLPLWVKRKANGGDMPLATLIRMQFGETNVSVHS